MYRNDGDGPNGYKVVIIFLESQLQFFKCQSQPDQGLNPEGDAHLLNTKPEIRIKPKCFKMNIYLTFL